MSAIFLGSFKPPHMGHWRIVELLLEKPGIKDVYVIISGKEREGVTADQSWAVWNIYRDSLTSNERKRVHVKIATQNPVFESAALTRKLLKETTGKVYLVKSAKDESNNRFSLIKRLSKERVQVIIIPTFKQLHSTDMRKVMDDYQSFAAFLPDKLTDKKKKEIWHIFR